ncbi:MAG: DUF1365 domain-containing protein [Geodermatophilaceae bacterium]|nr:DUF1365 domain-containing protein [Geodermatophilaceae bacterium]
MVSTVPVTPRRAPDATPAVWAAHAPPTQTLLYDAVVSHIRRAVPGGPQLDNAFSYGVHMWLVDLDALPRMPRGLGWVARFDARDHLGAPERTIRANVAAFLAARGVDLEGGRILMLANARVAGYVFNPISVHWCYAANGTLAAIVAEVHNTYGERHAYLLRPDAAGRAQVDKDFYVSPFFTVDGRYLMRFSPPGGPLSVTMALRQGDSTPFTATLRGTPRPASTLAALRAFLRHPFMPLRVSALIRIQGIALWARRLPVVRRPPHLPQEGVQ